MGLDEVPVDRFAEQAIDVLVARAALRLIEHQAFQIPDARHQVDPQQIGQAEHRCALRVGVAMQCIGLDVRFVLDQAVENVDRFVHAAWNEMAEERDVHVGHMVIADAAVPAVADVVFGEQILLVHIPLGPVGRHALSRAPVFRQQEFIVGVDDLDDGLFQPLLRDVVQVEPGDLLAAQVLDRNARFAWRRDCSHSRTVW